MSSAFAAGADGEEALSQALAPLLSKGWRELSDLRLPYGGNLDEVVVGPAGVDVVDSKNWSYSVTVKETTIYTGRYNRAHALDGMAAQVEVVKGALSTLAYPVAVRGFLALTGETNRGHPEESIRNVQIVGVDNLLDSLLSLQPCLSDAQIQNVTEVLSSTFPEQMTTQSVESAGSDEAVDSVKIHKLFDQNVRFFYLHKWNRYGKSRLYLKSSSGCDLGWKNINTGEIELTNAGTDTELIQAVLKSATPAGITLAIEQLPKLPLKIPAGKLLAHFAQLRAMVLVGQEHSLRGSRRLYGTLIDPGAGTFALGHADLQSGTLHPKINGNLSKHLSSAEIYLQLLVERLPKALTNLRS